MIVPWQSFWMNGVHGKLSHIQVQEKCHRANTISTNPRDCSYVLSSTVQNNRRLLSQIPLPRTHLSWLLFMFTTPTLKDTRNSREIWDSVWTLECTTRRLSFVCIRALSVFKCIRCWDFIIYHGCIDSFQSRYLC